MSLLSVDITAILVVDLCRDHLANLLWSSDYRAKVDFRHEVASAMVAGDLDVSYIVINSGGSRIFTKGMRNGGLGDGSPPAGSRGGAPVRVWGRSLQKLETLC